MSKTVMTTYTGRCLDLFDLKMSDISIRDIAHHTSLINRFCGASYGGISVAQHCVNVARMSDHRAKLQGLLHDASEAYMGDVIKWLKRHESFDFYRRKEESLQLMIFEKFNARNCDGGLQQDPSVDEADGLICSWEAHHQMRKLHNADGYPYKPLESWDLERLEKRCGRFELWSALQAEEKFLELFRELTEN